MFLLWNDIKAKATVFINGWEDTAPYTGEEDETQAFENAIFNILSIDRKNRAVFEKNLEFKEDDHNRQAGLFHNISERYMSDALDTILVLARQNNDNIDHIILLLSECIKFRSELCLDKSMNIFYKIIKSYLHYLSDTVIRNLNVGLENLLPESALKNEDGMEDIHQKLKWRVNGIWLLLALKDYFVGNNCEIPSYMKIWEEHCCDKNEFSEVRNSWLNYA
jgi:hypothetical protein